MDQFFSEQRSIGIGPSVAIEVEVVFPDTIY